MSIWTSFLQIWMFCNFEFNANFLTFLGLCIFVYHLLFDLETIGVKARNLNSRVSYFITTVNINVKFLKMVENWKYFQKIQKK